MYFSNPFDEAILGGMLTTYGASIITWNQEFIYLQDSDTPQVGETSIKLLK
jgi:hypothetical protein